MKRLVIVNNFVYFVILLPEDIFYGYIISAGYNKKILLNQAP